MTPTRIPRPGAGESISPLIPNIPSGPRLRPSQISPNINTPSTFRTNNPFINRLSPNPNPNLSPNPTVDTHNPKLSPVSPGTPPLHIQPKSDRSGTNKENQSQYQGKNGSPRFTPRQGQSNGSPSTGQQGQSQSRIPSPSTRTSKLPSNRHPNNGHNSSPNQKQIRKIPSGLTRRPVPALSPELRQHPNQKQNQSLSPPGQGRSGAGLMRKVSLGGPNKSCLRLQPSVPILRSAQAEARAREQQDKGRKRANSHHTPNNPSYKGLAPAADISDIRTIRNTNAHQAPLQSTRFASEVETAPFPSSGGGLDLGVPQHIRLRLRLLSALARTLELDQSEISRKIDVPGLLARVDKAYERRAGDERGLRDVGGTAVPMPLTPTDGDTGGEWWMYPIEQDLEGTRRSASLDLGEGRGLTSSFSLSNLGLGLGLGLGKDKVGKEDKDKKQGMLGRLKMFGRKSLDETSRPATLVVSPSLDLGEGTGREEGCSRIWNVPIFGMNLVDLPTDGWCTVKVGGQDHELPIPVYLLVEEIYRRGMDVPGIFRLAGKEAEVSKHYDTCNSPPFYGDGSDLSSPNVHSLSNVLKRFMRDLPEPILDDSLFPALWEWCCAPDFPANSMNCQKMDQPTPSRLAGAILIMKMLPPQHFSLLVYSLAFVTQLQFFPGNRLTLDAISIIFGPALLASRAKGVPGLGPGSKGKKHDPEIVSSAVDQSQKALGWLVRNWPEISKEILEPPFPSCTTTDISGSSRFIDPRLLSPIDMRGRNDSPFAVARPLGTGKSLDLDRSDPASVAPWDMGLGDSMLPYMQGNKGKVKSPGLLRSALSSRNLSGSFKEEQVKAPKRSASFNSLSSVFKKGIGMGKTEPKGLSASPTLSDYSTIIQTPSTSPNPAIEPASSPSSPRPSPSLAPGSPIAKSGINPQITNVLGSLQDLLLSKDRQIERDARELALLRHTLLEMDEKLQKALPANHTSLSAGDINPRPEIKITASPSVVSMNDTLLSDLQGQLSTALSALTQSRETTRQKDRQLVDLHTALARAESSRKIEVGKLEVALAMETARCKGLREERDLARERLDKVKKELFAVN